MRGVFGEEFPHPVFLLFARSTTRLFNRWNVSIPAQLSDICHNNSNSTISDLASDNCPRDVQRIGVSHTISTTCYPELLAIAIIRVACSPHDTNNISASLVLQKARNILWINVKLWTRATDDFECNLPRTGISKHAYGTMVLSSGVFVFLILYSPTRANHEARCGHSPGDFGAREQL